MTQPIVLGESPKMRCRHSPSCLLFQLLPHAVRWRVLISSSLHATDVKWDAARTVKSVVQADGHGYENQTFNITTRHWVGCHNKQIGTNAWTHTSFPQMIQVLLVLLREITSLRLECFIFFCFRFFLIAHINISVIAAHSYILSHNSLPLSIYSFSQQIHSFFTLFTHQ